MEDRMPMFILSLSWTDQGIRSVKDAPKRAQASRELAQKLGIEIKEVYLTSGDDDLLVIVDTPNGDNVAKYALALGSQANVRPRTAGAWPQWEFQKLIAELPYPHETVAFLVAPDGRVARSTRAATLRLRAR